MPAVPEDGKEFVPPPIPRGLANTCDCPRPQGNPCRQLYPLPAALHSLFASISASAFTNIPPASPPSSWAAALTFGVLRRLRRPASMGSFAKVTGPRSSAASGVPSAALWLILGFFRCRGLAAADVGMGFDGSVAARVKVIQRHGLGPVESVNTARCRYLLKQERHRRLVKTSVERQCRQHDQTPLNSCSYPSAAGNGVGAPTGINGCRQSSSGRGGKCFLRAHALEQTNLYCA